MKVLAYKISGLTPCHAVDEIRLSLSVLILETAIDCDREVAKIDLCRRVLYLRVFCKSAH